MRPPPKRTADQWADDNRILPPESPEPGRWRSARIPYMTPVVRAFADRDVDMVVVVCGAQMGKTESLFNVIGWVMDDRPVPSLYVGPSQKQTKSVSEDRIMKMIRSTPTLWSKLEKGQRNRISEKYIAGVRLGFAWASSAIELASHPAGLVMIDERDRMVSDIDNEGDPVVLAEARTKNYLHSKVGVWSTPTIDGASPIASLWEAGTRGRWSWPCPHCGEYFVPTIADLRWPDKATAAAARFETKLLHAACGALLEDADKDAMNSAGRYRFHELRDGVEHPIDEPARNPIASYWISGIASPWVTFGELASRLISAYESREQGRIQSVINTYAGELFRTEGTRADWETVYAKRQPYQRGTVPTPVQLVTLGADVQKDGIIYVVRGWGFNQESWLIDEGFVRGSTEFDDVWILFHGVVSREYWDKRIVRGFVDSGYKPGSAYRRPDHQVYQFARRHPGQIFPTKGHDQQPEPIKRRFIDLTVDGQVVKHGLALWHLDTDHLKQWLVGRYVWPTGESGDWHIHAEVSEEYCRQCAAEEMVEKASGRRIWISRGRANHYFDAEVLALAAAMSLNVEQLPELAEAQATAEATAARTARDKLPREDRADSHFVRRGL